MINNDSDSYTMTGGDGPYSYSRNSSYQRIATEGAKIIVDKAITENFDIKAPLSSLQYNSIRIADLGCSVGPNTFIVMQNIIDAVQQKYNNEGLATQIPEFEVFYNDHVSNDFNALFSSLPPNRKYFAAGVPGSFYNRLFPESSLHIVHSSYALHWLSMVPEELLDKNSGAWNRGRAHYFNAPNEVGKAYSDQFAKDMKSFLDARSKELVAGGLMVLVMPGAPNENPHCHAPTGIMFDLLGSSLMDMAKDGTIREDQMDNFNFPVYAPSPEEMRLSIEENGFFSIERMDLRITGYNLIDSETLTMHMRAGLEGLIGKNLGREIIDELFSRFHDKVLGSFNLIQSLAKGKNQLLIVLRRK